MKIIGEFFVEIFWERIVVNFFGYYTLFIIFKIFGNNTGVKWLNEISDDESEELSKGCIINIAGMVLFFLFVCLIAYFYCLIDNY